MLWWKKNNFVLREITGLCWKWHCKIVQKQLRPQNTAVQLTGCKHLINWINKIVHMLMSACSITRISIFTCLKTLQRRMSPITTVLERKWYALHKNISSKVIHVKCAVLPLLQSSSTAKWVISRGNKYTVKVFYFLMWWLSNQMYCFEKH